MNYASIYKLLPKFKEKFVVEPVTKFGRQKRLTRNGQFIEGVDVSFEDYRQAGRVMRDSDWISHFSQRIEIKGSYAYGSYALSGFFGGLAKWCCIDADNQDEVDLLTQKLIPKYQEYELDYIYEHSGTHGNKAHTFFLCNTEIKYLTLFLKQLFEESGIDWREIQEKYPIGGKQKNLIRPPGGMHLRTLKVNDVEFKSIKSKEPEFILESFIKANVLEEADLIKRLKNKIRTSRDYEEKEIKDTFIVDPKLTFPIEDLPELIHKVSTRCQALNKLLLKIKNDDWLDKRGGTFHDAGLVLSGWVQFNDYIKETDNGKVWFKEKLIPLHRTRSDKSHNWDYYWKKNKNPNRVVTSCQKMDEMFGLCDSCPFKTRTDIRSPKQLFWAK